MPMLVAGCSRRIVLRMLLLATLAMAAALAAVPSAAHATVSTLTIAPGDFNGDGHPDLLVRKSDETLWLYPRNGSAGFGNGGYGIQVGHSWGFTKIAGVGDFNGDGHPDLMAVDSSGNLWLYEGNGAGGFLNGGNGIPIGNGWAGYKFIFGVGDFNSDGHNDIMGVDSLGNLYLYEGNGAGGFLNGGNGILIGNGWSGYTAATGVGDFNGDGHPDIMGVDSLGNLYLYEGNGAGTFLNGGAGIKIGNSWSSTTSIFGLGDFNSDGHPDLMAVSAAGNLTLYEGNGGGTWLNSSGLNVTEGFYGADPHDSPPYANVINAEGKVVKRFGARYEGAPGSQIQKAETFAECEGTESCPATLPVNPRDPKVALEPGAFNLVVPYGKVQTIGGRCEGIFAYSGVQLEGSAAPQSVVKNAVTSPAPCSTLANILMVAANPQNIAAVGTALNLSSVTIQSGSAEYGVELSGISGPGLSASGITESGSTQAGMRIGSEPSPGVVYPVKGTAASPAKIANNVVEHAGNEGIVLNGEYISASGNRVTSTSATAIAVFGPSTKYDEVAHNTIVNGQFGVSLDGSGGTGEHNSAYSNAIQETCQGMTAYAQLHANLAGNTMEDPYTGWKQKTGECGNFGSTSVGIAIMNSSENNAWANQVRHYEDGVWLKIASHNQIGRVPGGGVEGNWILYPAIGLRVQSFGFGHDELNEIVGNVVTSWSSAPCEYDSQQISSGNTPSSC